MIKQKNIRAEFSKASGVSVPKPRRADVSKLRKLVKDGGFSEAAAVGDVDFNALIALSDEVEIHRGGGARPTFDIAISPDPLTLTVANRLHKPLHDMGFDPVLIVKNYKYPREMSDPQLGEFIWQIQTFNDIILNNNPMTAYPSEQYLSPQQLSHCPTVKKVLDVDALSGYDVQQYMKNPDKAVSITASFRLSELMSDKLIEIFRHPDQDVHSLDDRSRRLEHKTYFRSKFNMSGKDDDGMRTSILVNKHPSLTDHGVIPPFWPMLRLLKFVNNFDIDYHNLSAKEVADICEEKNCYDYGVDPYLGGMLHHVQREFDTGAVIFSSKSDKPIDLKLSMWENYFSMQDVIVDSILASAAAYKMGLDLNGVKQDLEHSQYHSYPGPDSRPPSYFSEKERKEIKKNDFLATQEFKKLGGKICSWSHFLKIVVEGDPDTGAPGFVPKNSPAYNRIKNLLIQENEFRRERIEKLDRFKDMVPVNNNKKPKAHDYVSLSLGE